MGYRYDVISLMDKDWLYLRSTLKWNVWLKEKLNQVAKQNNCKIVQVIMDPISCIIEIEDKEEKVN